MTTIEVNYFIRLLSSIYVYFWIPIRLNYLRLKFKLRPLLTISWEVFAIMSLVITGVPSSVLYMFAKGLTYIIEVWIKWLCNIIEETTGIDSKCLTDSVLSGDCKSEDLFKQNEEETLNESSIEQGNTNEQTIDDTVSESVGSDDKNELETTE